MSLFCGCGGFDLGLAQNGIKCTVAFDINKHAVSVYNKNLSPVAVAQDLTRQLNFEGIKTDIIISGAPCQGFSIAGKRDLNDPRNKLFLRAIEIALCVKPKVFVAENVSGILSGKHKTEYMDAARAKLIEGGYKTLLEVIDCRNLGMAQMRKRALLIAWNTQKDLILNKKNIKPKKLQDVIKNIPENTQNHDVSGCMTIGTNKIIAEYIKQGQKLSNVRNGERSVHTWDIPKVFGETTEKEREVLEALLRIRRKVRVRDWGDSDPVSLDCLKNFLGYSPNLQIRSLKKKNFLRDKADGKIDLTNTFNGKFRRLSWEEQSLTVDTRFGSPILFLHPTENRAYTVREAARLQGFPDSFIFDGPLKNQYEMVGNAVPPPLGMYIAELIVKVL